MCIVESARGKRKKRGSFFFSKNSLLTSAALLLHFSVYLSTRCDNKFSAVSTTSSTASTYCACLAFKFWKQVWYSSHDPEYQFKTFHTFLVGFWNNSGNRLSGIQIGTTLLIFTCFHCLPVFIVYLFSIEFWPWRNRGPLRLDSHLKRG